MKKTAIGAALLAASCAMSARNVGETPCVPSAQRDPASLVTETFVGFIRDCVSGDLGAAERALAPMQEGVPSEYVAGKLQRLGRIGLVDPARVLSVKTVGDKAVLVYSESETDLDPIYFVWEDGEWRILLTLTRFDKSVFAFTPDDLSEFRVLESWFCDYKGLHSGR